MYIDQTTMLFIWLGIIIITLVLSLKSEQVGVLFFGKDNCYEKKQKSMCYIDCFSICIDRDHCEIKH